MFAFPYSQSDLANSFTNKIITGDDYLSAFNAKSKSPAHDNPTVVKRATVKFAFGDRVQITAGKLPSKHCSWHILEDVTGTVVDVAPYGGNGCIGRINGDPTKGVYIDQVPIYRIKLDRRVKHVAASEHQDNCGVGRVDDIIAFNTKLIKKI
jgi:hypothetical protein